MPSKKKKYNARFPAGRIKKIMQTDEEVGKVAQAVPVIISRTLELFVESLLKKAMLITSARNAKTLTPTHMKQCILSESRFDFLKDLVKCIPDVSSTEEEPTTPGGNRSPRLSQSFGGMVFNRSTSKTTESNFSKNEPGHSQVTTPSSMYPRFYNEIPIESQEHVKEPGSLQRPVVIQHTSSAIIQHTSSALTNSFTQSATISNSNDDDKVLNGSYRPGPSLTIHKQLDEDYDT